jgi:DNA polymerase-3 subunit beta
MKIAIDKNILVNALDTVVKAVPTGKVVIQALEGILIEASDGKLSIVKNNLESAIKHTVKCEVIKPGKAIVNAKMISDIVHKMPDEELDITVQDKKMTIEAGKAVMKVPVIEAEYPGLPDITEKARFEIDKKTLVNAINGVAFAVFEGEDKPALTGIKLVIENNLADIVAIDGYMVAYRKISLSAPNSTALLSGKSLENAVKSIGENGIVTVILSDNMAMLVTEDTQINVRAVDGTYMNYRRYMQTEIITTACVNSRELVRSLERALLVFETGAKGSVSEPLKIISKGESLNLTMHGDKGTFDEEIFCGDISGDKIEIGLDPRRILTCLKHIDSKEVMLGFAGNLGPAFIMPVEGDSYKYMVMAVRTK